MAEYLLIARLRHAEPYDECLLSAGKAEVTLTSPNRRE